MTKVRPLYPRNNSLHYINVEPIPKSKEKINGTIVKNIDKDKVILLTISEKKPRIPTFFKEWQPRLVLRYKDEFDATDVKSPMWAMIANVVDDQEVS